MPPNSADGRGETPKAANPGVGGGRRSPSLPARGVCHSTYHGCTQALTWAFNHREGNTHLSRRVNGAITRSEAFLKAKASPMVEVVPVAGAPQRG